MVSEIVCALTPFLKAIEPRAEIYQCPVRQGAKTPCFFAFAPIASADRGVNETRHLSTLMQIVYLPEEHNRRAAKATQEVLAKLLQVMGPLETSLGVVIPRDVQGEADEDNCQLQFTIRWREKQKDSSPIVEQVSTEGVIM